MNEDDKIKFIDHYDRGYSDGREDIKSNILDALNALIGLLEKL